ncbi:MAG: FAD-dependent oxidoreductase [Acidobacteriota bacterium]|nr:FAD-dependent oxidoreductase [Acidobacteriota bacterium]
MYTYSKTIPVIAAPDVLVAGSGSAGSTAAIAAARVLQSSNPQGKVMLVERYGFLGGTSTAVLDTFYGFYTPGAVSKKVVSGIPDDVVAGLRTLDRVIERPNTFGAGTGVTYNPEFLKVVWERLAQQAGVDLLLHTFITDVVLEGNRITGIVVDGKSGLGLIRPKIIIDASGDADVCALAQVPFEKAGDIDPAQTLTTTFKLANVNVATARKFSRADFLARMGEAADSGKYDLPRREGSVHITPIEGVMATIMTRLEVADPTNPRDLTSAEIEGRRQALEYERFLRDYIPGYEAARLVTFSTQIGVRETRRVYGEYRLTREDVLSARKFDDVIGLCGAPIEDHHAGATTKWLYLPDGATVDIPYRTLVPRNVDNLYVAGRCFSATHDAHASVRSMAQCMAMGQAAGAAAALCLCQNSQPRDLNVQQLQDKLRNSGAILETPGEGVFS